MLCLCLCLGPLLLLCTNDRWAEAKGCVELVSGRSPALQQRLEEELGLGLEVGRKTGKWGRDSGYAEYHHEYMILWKYGTWIQSIHDKGTQWQSYIRIQGYHDILAHLLYGTKWYY